MPGFPTPAGSVRNRSCEPVYSQAAGSTIRVGGGPGRGKATRPSPLLLQRDSSQEVPLLFSLSLSLIPARRSPSLLSPPSLLASPPSFHLPPAFPGRLAPALLTSFQLFTCGVGGRGGCAGGRTRTLSPRTPSPSPSPSPRQHPLKSYPRSRIPEATQLCRAGAQRIPRLGRLRPVTNARQLGRPEPGDALGGWRGN